MNNETYITEYIQTRGLSRKTHQLLRTVINHYCKYQQCTIHDLLIEADQEEEAGIRWKHRRLKKRLTNYTNHLKQTMDLNSAKTYLMQIKSFYTHNEIEIGKLPPINKKNAKVHQPITYQDLPTKEIIREAVKISNPLMKSIILFLATTGMAKVDMRNISIHQFLISTTEYHNAKTINQLINELDNIDGVIPTWKLRRSKTNKYFITFNTGECTKEIINQLKIRNNKKPLQLSDKLFPIGEHYFTAKFEEINDALGLGKVGAYNRFRGHSLRKFHSSNLAKAGMERYKINVLQDKSNNRVDDVYFFEDETVLKQEYVKHIDVLLFFDESKKVEVLQSENDFLRLQAERIRELQREVDLIKDNFIFE